MPNNNQLLKSHQLKAILEADPNQQNWVIVDLSQPQVYARHHIEGARHLDPRKTLSNSAKTKGELPQQEQIKSIMSHLGLLPSHRIVVYDDEGGGWAGRFFWLMDSISHPYCAYLDGGIHAWLKAGLATTPITPQYPATHYPPTHYPITQIQPQCSVNRSFIVQHQDDPSVKIWDARSPQEYAGSVQYARRGGHIPRAFNLDWRAAMDSAQGFTICTDLAARLLHFGVTCDTTLITYCQAHHRSAFAYMAAKMIGIKDVRAYSRGWDEWGNNPSLPITTD